MIYMTAEQARELDILNASDAFTAKVVIISEEQLQKQLAALVS